MYVVNHQSRVASFFPCVCGLINEYLTAGKMVCGVIKATMRTNVCSCTYASDFIHVCRVKHRTILQFWGSAKWGGFEHTCMIFIYRQASEQVHLHHLKHVLSTFTWNNTTVLYMLPVFLHRYLRSCSLLCSAPNLNKNAYVEPSDSLL